MVAAECSLYHRPSIPKQAKIVLSPWLFTTSIHGSDQWPESKLFRSMVSMLGFLLRTFSGSEQVSNARLRNNVPLKTSSVQIMLNVTSIPQMALVDTHTHTHTHTYTLTGLLGNSDDFQCLGCWYDNFWQRWQHPLWTCLTCSAGEGEICSTIRFQ